MSRAQLLTVFGVAGLVAFVAGEGSALAEGKANNKTGTVEVMTFDDDKLLSTVLTPSEGSVLSRKGPVRMILVRPRTSFVPELFQSIERL